MPNYVGCTEVQGRDFSSDAMDLRPAHVPGTLAASP